MQNQYDVTIVGAGLVGASLALALKTSGLKIALIEALPPNPADGRLFALNFSSVEFLKYLKVWPLIQQHATSIKRVHVSRRGRFGVMQLNSDDMQLPALGFMVPAKCIEAALLDLLQQEPLFLDCYRPVTLNQLTVMEEGIKLSLDRGLETPEITTRYLFGADGTKSTVRQLMGWQTTTLDNDETAIVAEMMVSQAHHQVAYERFYDQGVIAVLPLQEKHVAVILSTNTVEAKRLLALSSECFLGEVQTVFGRRLGKLHTLLSCVSYPLRTVLAKNAASKNVLLLGNAAHTVHPVAAQGFNLALYEVALLLDRIKDQLVTKSELTHLNCLEVEAQFVKTQTMSIHVSRGLSGMASHSSWLQQVGMQMGMIALEMQPSLKKYFVNALLHRHGRMPRAMTEKVCSLST